MGALPKRKTSTYRKGKRRVDLKRRFADKVSRLKSQAEKLSKQS